jgi:hypothetical protein
VRNAILLIYGNKYMAISYVGSTTLSEQFGNHVENTTLSEQFRNHVGNIILSEQFRNHLGNTTLSEQFRNPNSINNYMAAWYDLCHEELIHYTNSS